MWQFISGFHHRHTASPTGRWPGSLPEWVLFIFFGGFFMCLFKMSAVCSLKMRLLIDFVCFDCMIEWWDKCNIWKKKKKKTNHTPKFKVIVCPSLNPRSSLGPASNVCEFFSSSASCFNHLKLYQSEAVIFNIKLKRTNISHDVSILI